MATNFVNNLRALRAAQNREQAPNMPVTRGDMQKARRASARPVPEERLPQPEWIYGYIDKMPPEEAEKRHEQDIANEYNAYAHSLRGDERNRTANRFSEESFKWWFFNDDIYNNYDKLMSVIDLYDAANNSKEEKRATLKDLALRIGDDSNTLKKWFDVFNSWNDVAYDTGDSPSMVSKKMRSMLDFTKNNLHKYV